jgi:uncharacterized membrane protein
MSTTAPQASGTASPPTAQGRTSPEDPLARLLGWASFGLGVAMTSQPGRFARAIGVRDDAESRAWTVAVGVREHMHAAGILVLGRPRPAGWVWTRVAGDAMDLALLVNALRSKPRDRTRVMAAIGAALGIGVIDLIAAMRLTRKPGGPIQGKALHAHTAITVRRQPDEVYAFWHELENLPRFMAHLESVEPKGDGLSHWKAKGPAGRTVEWDARIVEDRPGELISWQTVDGSAVQTTGTVRFVPAPGARGTVIHLDMDYAVPGGAVGSAIAKLFGEEPQVQVKDDLRRFKQVVETGVLVRSEGSPEGTLSQRYFKQRPAQPMRSTS